MAFRVPDEQIGYIKKLLDLPEATIGLFVAALASAEPKFNVSALSAEISQAVELPEKLTLGIVQVLASLYLTMGKEPIEIFIDKEVFGALKRANTFSKENADSEWQKLRMFLLNTLSLERSIGIAAKAGKVLTEHERVFKAARIISDIRPIFQLDVSKRPEAALIVHMLKITQQDKFGNQADKYFALDSNDIVRMKEIIDRALKKEQTLKDMMKASGVIVLDPMSIY